MRFDSYVEAENGVVGADPIAAPQNVADEMVTDLRERDPKHLAAISKIVVGLEAPTGETVDVSIYALDDSTQELAVGSRKWYLIGAIAGLAGGTLEALSDNVVGGGRIYIRVTAETITVNRRIGIRAASA